MDFSELKTRAKKSLSGHWKDTLVVFIVFSLLTSLTVWAGPQEDKVTVTYSIFSLISFVITCLLGFGYLNYFLELSRDKKVEWKELFSKTSMAIEYFVLALMIGIFVCLWTFLLIIPGIIAAIKYSQAFYIKLDNKDLGVFECIDKSKEIMNGHKMDYFLLILSFIGWAILGIFTLGILYFWLVPYYSVTLCNFYNEIKQ